MANSTIEELVLFMYNESNQEHRQEIQRELEENWVLREKYKVIKESSERLDRMKLQSPRYQTIDAIMQYAKSTAKVIND